MKNMTVDEIIEEYHLDKTEQKEFRRICVIFFHYYSFFAIPDEHLKYLVGQIYQTIHERDNTIDWKLVILNIPMEGFNSGTLSLTENCKLVICDSYIMDIANTIARLIGKLIPRCKDGGIVPSIDPDDPDHIDDDFDDIMEKMNNVHDYNEFKKTILYFHNFLYDIDFNLSETDKISEQLRDEILLFLFAHELAHIMLNHKISKKVAENLKNETDADLLGYELMVSTMLRIHQDVIRKAQFNLGFEIFLKCLATGELLSLIFNKFSFSETHPDVLGFRLDSLRKKVEENVLQKINEETVDTIIDSQIEIGSFRYITDISNKVFDTYERKLVQEIIGLAAILDRQYHDKEVFLNKLKDKIKKFSIDKVIGFSETYIPGLNKWKNGYFTKAVCEFAEGGYGEKFYHILAILHWYEFDKHYSRMCYHFADGVDHLQNEHFDLAEEYFQRFCGSGGHLVQFALGYTYSKIGEEYLSFEIHTKNNLLKTIQYFNRSIETSPVVRIETFEYRCASYKELHNNHAASKDKKILHILHLMFSYREGRDRFLELSDFLCKL